MFGMRYSQLTNDQGGIIDDLIVTNEGGHLFLVVNGANKDADLAHMRAALPPGIEIEHRTEDALLAGAIQRLGEFVQTRR